MNFSRSATGVLDQGVLSAAAFGIHILLAFVLPLSEYGKFAVGYAGLTLLLAVHQATIQQPLVVLSAGRHAAQAPGVANHFLHVYVKKWLGGVISAAIVAFAVGVVWLTARDQLWLLCITLIASSAFLMMHLLRRVWHTSGRIGVSLLGNSLYLVVVFTILVGLQRMGSLTAGAALVAIFIASLVTCAVWLLYHAPQRRARISGRHRDEVSQATVAYARWALPSQATLWIMDNGPYLVVGFTGGLSSIGALRAVGNFVLPFLHVVVGVSNLMLVTGAQSVARGPAMLRREFHRSTFVLGLVAAIFSAALFLVPAVAVRLHLPLQFDPLILFLASPLPIVWSIQGVAITFLRSMEQPRKVLLATSTAVAFGIPLVIAVAAAWGAAGAMVGWVVMSSLGAIIAILLCDREIKSKENVPGDVHNSQEKVREGLDLN